MVILQWTGTAGLGGPPAAPVGHNLPRPLGARLLPKLEPGWRVAEFVLRKTNLTFGGNKQLTKKLFRRPGRNARLLAGQLPSSFARTCCLDRIQRTIDLGQKALDFITLVRAETLLQPFEQLLLSHKQFCCRCHLLTNPGLW